MSSFEKIDRCLSSDKNETMPVNACVGSGKTDLACYSFGKWIVDHFGEKTVSVFVSPRIKLCNQQTESIERFIDGTFGLVHGRDYKVVPINSGDVAKLTDFDRRSGDLSSKHVIFVFCSASLWATDDSNSGDPEYRWHLWTGNFKSWSEDSGYRLGSVFYDESHNYEAQADKIGGLADSFKLTMLASGTPAYFQKELTRVWKRNACECSPSEAMAQGMVCKPSLNMIKGSSDHDFPAAIAATLRREIEICSKEPFGVTLLVNCSSIDQIKAILDHKWFDGKVGKDFHVITIHSSKNYTADDNSVQTLDSMIDSATGVDSQKAYEAIESLDGGYFKDSLPVIVFQVGMIGEGINVKSFNSVIVTTHADRQAMQQIGRAVRNHFSDGKDKIRDGHANVYAFVENVEDLQRLVVNLQEYNLTEDCYTWGRQIDVSTGSALDHNDELDTAGKLNGFDWNDLDDLDIQEIIAASDIRSTKKNNVEFVNELIDDNPELVEEFLNQLKGSAYAKEFMKQSVPFDAAKFRNEIKKAKDKRLADNVAGSGQPGEKKQKENSENTDLSKSVIIGHLMKLKDHAKKNPVVFPKLWRIEDNRCSFLTKIFGNPIVGKFFSKTLTERTMKKIAKV